MQIHYLLLAAAAHSDQFTSLVIACIDQGKVRLSTQFNGSANMALQVINTVSDTIIRGSGAYLELLVVQPVHRKESQNTQMVVYSSKNPPV